jgi:hypothetical protein
MEKKGIKRKDKEINKTNDGSNDENRKKYKINQHDIYQSLLSNETFIPEEVMVYIFGFLSKTDLLNVSLTCRYWYHLSRACKLWNVKDRKMTMEDDKSEKKQRTNGKRKKIGREDDAKRIKKQRSNKKFTKKKIGVNNKYNFSLQLQNGVIIPDEIIVHILSFLPIIDIIRGVSMTCRHWYHLSCSLKLWEGKELQIVPSNHKYGHLYGEKRYYGIKSILKFIKPRSQYITSLCIEPVPISDKILKNVLKNCPELRFLQIIGPKTTRNQKLMIVEDDKMHTLKQLEYGKKLEGFRVGYLKYKETRMESITYLSNLKSLDIVSGHYIVAKMIDAISIHCKHLIYLTLGIDNKRPFMNSCSFMILEGDKLHKLTECTDLRYLVIKRCSLYLTKEDLAKFILDSKKLTILRLSYLCYDFVYCEDFFEKIENNTVLKFLELKTENRDLNISYKMIQKLPRNKYYNFWNNKILKGNPQNIYCCESKIFYAYKLLGCLIYGIPRLLAQVYPQEEIYKSINECPTTVIYGIFERLFPVNRRKFKLFAYDIPEFKNEYFTTYHSIYVWILLTFVLEYFSYTLDCVNNGLISFSNYGMLVNTAINSIVEMMKRTKFISKGTFFLSDFIFVLSKIRNNLYNITNKYLEYKSFQNTLPSK